MRFRALWGLRSFARPHGKVLVLGLLIMALNGFLEMRVMWETKEVFEPLLERLQPAVTAERRGTAIGDEETNRDTAKIIDDLYQATVRLMLFFMAAALSTAGSFYIGEWISQRVLVALRSAVFNHLQGLSLSFFERGRSGELISRVNNDTMILQRVMGPNFGRLVVSPFAVLFSVGAMLRISPTLTLATAVIIPVIVVVTNRLGKRVRRYARTVQEKTADLTAVVSEAFQGVRVVKIFGMEEMVGERFGRENVAVLTNEMRANRMRALNIVTVGVLTGVAICASLLVGAWEIASGHSSPAGLMTFILVMQVAASRLSYLSRTGLQLQMAESAASRTLEILGEKSELAEAEDALALEDVRGEISLEGVTFAYNDEPVLHDLNLRVAAGEVVALAGPSGAGKTTIANIVARLYDVNEGSVCIDGVDVRRLKSASLKANMGIVPQETLLFSASVSENIGYGRPGASDEEIVAAAKAANAHDFIMSLPEGYATPVGERGTRLSGGQRQRIAIARALLRDPAILILDEATSSLDAESEADIHRALQMLLQGRTAIIIAHRLSTIQNADRIVVLQDGRVAEQGTHGELMADHGLYRRLYETRSLVGRRSETGEHESATQTPETGEDGMEHAGDSADAESSA